MYRNFAPGADDHFDVAPSEPTPPARMEAIPRLNGNCWFFPHEHDIETVLKLAKLLISEGDWCKGHLATDANDVPVYELGAVAENYCIIGAVRRVNHVLPVPRFFANFWRQRRYAETIRVICRVIDTRMIDYDSRFAETAVMHWNDHHGYGEVLAAFNRAIVIAPYAEIL